MKVGDYVRNKDGIIGKIIKEQPFMNDILIFLDNEQGNITYQSKDGVFKVNHKEDIIKSSPNIIDLIQEGDFVNTHKVIERSGKLMLEDTFDLVEDEPIESIVTKEQFEAMEYKVEV